MLLKVTIEHLHQYTGEAYYDLPGGRIHRGERVTDALIREVEEETGITSVKDWTPLSMVLSPLRIPHMEGEDVGLILAVYVGEVEGDPVIILSDESIEYGWFSAAEAAQLLSVKFPKEFTDQLVLEGAQ